jgi:hypothetical protein
MSPTSKRAKFVFEPLRRASLVLATDRAGLNGRPAAAVRTRARIERMGATGRFCGGLTTSVAVLWQAAPMVELSSEVLTGEAFYMNDGRIQKSMCRFGPGSCPAGVRRPMELRFSSTTVPSA